MNSACQAVAFALREYDVVNLACELIRIPSPTESEATVIDYLTALFESEGFDLVDRYDVSPGRPQVIAVLRGTGGGRSLMFNGHLDNDSITYSWKGDPYQPVIEGNKLWGAGVHNMKSGIAAMVGAAVAVKRSGVRLAGDLVVACVVGELQGGKGTLSMLDRGYGADAAVVPEPYSVSNIITKCVGVHKFSVTTIGRSVHTSRSETGVDAIQKMIEVIARLRAFKIAVHDPDFPGVPRLLVSSIIGGRGRDYDLAGPSNVSDICTIIVDYRYPEGVYTEGLDDEFKEFFRSLEMQDSDLTCIYEHPPDPRFRVGGADMPPMNVPADAEIAQMVAAEHERITGSPISGVGAVVPFSYCGNDTAHLQRAGIPCCLYGPRGYPDDVEKHVRIDEMLTCAEVLAFLVVEYCGGLVSQNSSHPTILTHQYSKQNPKSWNVFLISTISN